MACEYCSDDNNIHSHNRKVLEKATRGDVIEFKRIPHSHYGVYTGDSCQVIHYAPHPGNTKNENKPTESISSPCGARFDKANVQRGCIFEIAGFSRIYINNKFDDFITPKTDNEILELAKADLGESKGGYNVLTHNCENEAIYWRYGVDVLSNQIEKFFCFMISTLASLTDSPLKEDALEALGHFHHLKQIKVLWNRIGNSTYFKPLVIVLGLVLKAVTKIGKMMCQRLNFGFHAMLNVVATVIETFHLDIYAKISTPSTENSTAFRVLQFVLTLIICKFNVLTSICTRIFSLKSSSETMDALHLANSSVLRKCLAVLLEVGKIAVSYFFPILTIIMQLFGDDCIDYLLKTIVAAKDFCFRQIQM